MAAGGHVNSSQKLLWNLYAAAVGAATTMVTAKALESVWKLSTGDEPPLPSDPQVPLRHALIWTVASALGIGLAQVVVNRFAATQWVKFMGTPAPTAKHTHVTI